MSAHFLAEVRGLKYKNVAAELLAKLLGVDLGLNDDEVAFYDALAANDSAVEAMGKDELKVIAAELVTQVRKSVTIDWTLRESARAKIKVLVKRILRKHGYPPDLQAKRSRPSSPKPSCFAPFGWREKDAPRETRTAANTI